MTSFSRRNFLLSLDLVGFEPNATMNTAHHMLLYGCGEPGSEKPVWYVPFCVICVAFRWWFNFNMFFFRLLLFSHRNCGEMAAKDEDSITEVASPCKQASQVKNPARWLKKKRWYRNINKRFAILTVCCFNRLFMLGPEMLHHWSYLKGSDLKLAKIHQFNI